MDNEIKRTYSSDNDEVFTFNPTSHNSDKILNVFEEANRGNNIENDEVYSFNVDNYKNTQFGQDEIFLRSRQEAALGQTARMANKSIGNDRRTEYKYRKRNSNIIIARKQREVASMLCAIVIATGLTFTGVKTIQKVDNWVQTQVNVKNGTDTLVEKAIKKLCNNDLATIDEKGKCVVGENDISDYRKLNISDHLDVYIYRLILPRNEFDKFIRATSYNHGYSYYTSMRQFLIVNGYYASGTNNPSIDVFNNMMENRINNIAERLYYVEENTFDEESSLQQSKTRGGI